MWSNLWYRLAPRERRLASVTAAVVVAAFGVLVASKALASLSILDDEVSRREQDLINYVEEEARGVSVDRAFAEIAAQHSSSWNEAEIHNRLRQEIYRLAVEDPDAPPGRSKNLVEIPTLRQGTLKEGGGSPSEPAQAGYREYQLSIRIPSADVYSTILFLIRLQNSPQSLRIDGLEIARAPDSQLVSATINVTRTVVDGAPQETAPGPRPAPEHEQALTETMAWDGGRVEQWLGHNCDLSLTGAAEPFSGATGDCLRAVATAAGAYVCIAQTLRPGSNYEMTLDARSNGPATLCVRDEQGAQSYDAERALLQGTPLSYRVRFTTPPALARAGPVSDGNTLNVRAPCILLPAPGAEVFLDNVTLRLARAGTGTGGKAVD